MQVARKLDCLSVANTNQNYQTMTDYVAGIIETGQELIIAQTEHSKSLRKMAKDLPFSWQTAHKLMEIADKFGCRPVGDKQKLPHSWRTLYELTLLPFGNAKHQ